MRRPVTLLILCLFLPWLAGAAASVAAAELVDRIVAHVNDEIITLSELTERTRAFVAARHQNPFVREQDQSLEEIRREILDNMINELLADQEIARLGISVSKGEVDEVIARIKEENHLDQEALEAQLRKEGKSLEDLRQRIREDLERTRLINREVRKKVVITDEQVEAYYRSHQEEFQGQVRWRLQDIFLPFADGATLEGRVRVYTQAERILERLGEGADFASMARRYSQGPGAEEGGDLGFFTEGELDPVLARAVKNLEVGEVSPVITTEPGVHIIRLMEVNRTPSRPLEEVRESIRRLLLQKEVNSRYEEWIKDLRERSYVKITY